MSPKKPTIDDLKIAVNEKAQVREIPIQTGSPYNFTIVGWRLQARTGDGRSYHTRSKYKFAAYSEMATKLGIQLNSNSEEEEPNDE